MTLSLDRQSSQSDYYEFSFHLIWLLWL